MHYVCITENNISSILNYEPNVPSDVEIVTISDEEHALVMAGTHKFDVSLRKVVEHYAEHIAKLEAEKENVKYLKFLSATDWKVLRHVREKALDIATTLSDEEYIALEQQRQAAADSIVK